MSPLDRKLARDLWRTKGQAVAIALVIGVGTLLLVMMGGLVTTLENTRAAYYDRYRFADVFAPAARAPDHVLEALAAIPGVATVEGRVVGTALVDLPEEDLPIRAQVVSLPDRGRPRLNDFHLVAGRELRGGRRDEILLIDGFAAARGLEPGDRLQINLNGTLRPYTIAGLVLAPEFLYATPPGELLPDDRRFAVIWMSESVLSAAFDQEGAFNEALLSLSRGARPEEVRAAIDLVLDPHGGVGAYDRADQGSNRFVSEEINGLRATSVSVPPIFLAVAAFLLFIVTTRMIQSEREEIGLLKAFGYSSAEVAWHYLKFVLVIAIMGALAGSAAGIAAGKAMAGFYQLYFKFPFLVFSLDPASFVTGFTASVLAACAGSLLVIRGVFRLSPAVAMRPPAPADYSTSRPFGPLARRLLDQPSRMVLRRLARHPWRMAASALGIATGMALAGATMTMISAFDEVLDTTFSVIDRSDATVTFVRPTSEDAVFDLRRVDGVAHAEPFRVVPAILRNGPARYRGAINGYVERPILNRPLDATASPIDLPPEGIVLSEPVADILGVGVGDLLTVEVTSGRRPVLTLPVAEVAQSLLGAPTYMRLDALNRAMREPGRIDGAFLTVDPAREGEVHRALKDMPLVAGVSLKADLRDALKDQMDQGAGAMRYIMALIAALIAFGIVFNSARIALAERARDLASLRVMGFTRAEAGFVLLGELAVVTVAALPVGAVMGWALGFAIAEGFSTDLYQVPAGFSPSAIGIAMLAVVAAGLVSGALVRRDLNRIDLVSALKTRD